MEGLSLGVGHTPQSQNKRKSCVHALKNQKEKGNTIYGSINRKKKVTKRCHLLSLITRREKIEGCGDGEAKERQQLRLKKCK